MARPFSVDIPGLMAALTQQFPEPLLCVRELVQNAADAQARHIDVELAYDPRREMLRLSVSDDGHGMGADEVEAYLVIGASRKDPSRDRGRFGIGKLSPYTLGIARMVVSTAQAEASHRITFGPDGAGTVQPGPGRRPGTLVRIYKRLPRVEAEAWVSQVRSLLEEHCGQLPLVLRFNGSSIRAPSELSGRYAVAFESETLRGRLGVSARPSFRLSSGGLLLESGTALFGPELSYELESRTLAPTLSRNAARRDQAFEAVVRGAKRHITRLAVETAHRLRLRVRALEAEGPVERGLDEDDRAALEWLRGRLMDRDGDPSLVEEAPVLETADGGLVSWRDVQAIPRGGGQVPVSRVPRSASELEPYAQRGLPVLLLYRDVEDFLDRHGLSSVEVDASRSGRRVDREAWSPVEAELLRCMRPKRDRRRGRGTWPRGLPILGAGLGVTLGLLLVAPSLEAPGALLQGSVSVIAPLTGLSRVLGWLLLMLSLGLGFGSLARFFWPARVRGLRRILLHPRDFWVAKVTALQMRGPIARAGFVEARDAEPVLVGHRVDLDDFELGLIELESPEAESRLFVLQEDSILLNRRHPVVRRLISRAHSEPVQARMLLETLIAADAEFARGADPRRLEWDLLVRHQRWLRRLQLGDRA